jgi:hypothetical protein
LVKREMKCLERLLQENQKHRDKYDNSTQQKCFVYIMADRPETLERLQRRVRFYNCTAVTADHETGSSFSDEHGPWSGVGFFQDLAVTSRARDGVISKGTSSSMLLMELIEYNTRMKVWEEQGAEQASALRPVSHCHIKENK